MRTSIRYRTLLATTTWAAILVTAALAPAQPQDVRRLPWKWETLTGAPPVHPAPGFEAEGVRAFFYEGPSWRGKPTRVFAWYGCPPVDPGRKVPAMVLVHGGGGTAFAEWVRLWNQRGYAAIAMDTCGSTPGGDHGKRPRHEHGGPPGWGGFDQLEEPVEDQWTYHAVADVLLAHSLIRSFPEVDADRIGITGISWGGYLTCIAAGVDERFKLAVPVYGCGFLADNSTWLETFKGMGEAKARRWLQLWDPSAYLPRAKMPMLWVTGTNDFAYPMDSLQKSYRLPAGERSLAIRIRMPHAHGGPGENPEEIHAFANRLLKEGEALPSVRRHGREGRRAWVEYSSAAPLDHVELVFTSDLGRWQDRRWTFTHARVDTQAGRAEAELPDSTTVYYFNLVDQKQRVISSEHEELPAAELPARVERDGSTWFIIAGPRRVRLDAATLAMSVQTPATTWTMLPSAAGDLRAEVGGKELSLRLADARRIDVTPFRNGFATGLRIALGDFAAAGGLELRLTVALERVSGELLCDVVASEDSARVRECRWPGAFDPAGIDATVVPCMQGMLLPRNWPQRVFLYDSISYGRGLYMPWWGQQRGSSAAVVILETPDDGGCHFEHPAGGPTLIQTRWLHSLGKLAYPRRVRISFIDSGNHVNMAKRYRRYVIETGRFVSLNDKIARSPLVGKLIGSPVVHTSILSHIQPESSYYDRKNPAANHVLTTFDARAADLTRLAEKGVERAYVHLDGWGLRGYDNLHPDVLPPCPEAGGWDAMKRFADTCDRLGYVFAVHDQYRDYYCDAPSYDEKLTIVDEKGNRPTGQTWWGGKQSILCPHLAPGHVSKNHRALLARGIKVRGAYLDVFAVVPGDECYSPDHPASRGECLKRRGECLDLIRALEGVVSSEEPADWAIRHIDLVHHAPFALDPNPGSGPAMGIPIPLFSLVYHDALLVPWSMGKGEWGIPKTDWGYLHGLANAGIPYVSLNPGEEEVKRVRTMCALHRRVGQLEMVGHEFLDPQRRRQRATFADGTTVTIDLEKDEFQIVPPLAPDDLATVLRASR